MTPRERVLAAFRMERVDRIPYYEQVVHSSVASKILGRPVHTGGGDLTFAAVKARLQGQSAYEDFREQAFQDYIELHKVLEFDMVRAESFSAPMPTAQLDEHTFLFGDPDSGKWHISKFDPESQLFHTVKSCPAPTADQIRPEIEERRKALEEHPLSEADFEPLIRVRDALPDRALLAQGCTFGIPIATAWLELLATDPGLVAEHIELCAERAMQAVRICKKLGANIAWGGGDLAHKNGPVYSPAIFRRIMLPRVKRVVDECHRLGMPYVFRSDGYLWPICDMLFQEIGCDGFGEIDAEAGMDLGELRARYPRLVFWGNVPCGTILHHGTVEDVKAAARECIAKTNGRGLILGSSNTVIHGTPPENVWAMLEVARAGP